MSLPISTPYGGASPSTSRTSSRRGEEKPEEGAAAELPIPDTFRRSPALRRYQVNVLVDSSGAAGAPVVYESNPSYLNLVGRVEQMSMMGALLTDFTLIKPGVLHRANGGYLILDAAKVLTNPYAWEGLKRALQFRQIRIESPGQMLSMTSTVSLEPEPIPLDLKVILMGDRQLYYLLAESDPEFDEFFKVAADFDDEFVRDDETTRKYARLIAGTARRAGLLPFDRPAVCRVVEHAAAPRRGQGARHRPDAHHRRPAAGVRPLGAARRRGAGGRRARAAGDRRPDLPLRPCPRTHARPDAARDGADRHRRAEGGAGQRAVSAVPRHVQLRPAESHHGDASTSARTR